MLTQAAGSTPGTAANSGRLLPFDANGTRRRAVHCLNVRDRKKEIRMAVYMVDRNLPGVTTDQLAAAQKAAIESSNKSTAEGKPVRYIRSTFVPADSRCMCLFEANSPDLVKDVNDRAQLPYTRIVEAADLTPRDR
jgi:hypothetical protein